MFSHAILITYKVNKIAINTNKIVLILICLFFVAFLLISPYVWVCGTYDLNLIKSR